MYNEMKCGNEMKECRRIECVDIVGRIDRIQSKYRHVEIIRIMIVECVE